MKGYKAKSHYLCIKKWVVDAVKKRKNIKENNSTTIINELIKQIEEEENEKK